MNVKCVANINSLLGECPIWSSRDQCLYWLDMYRPAIYRYRPEDNTNEQLPLKGPGYVSSFIPRKNGGFVLGTSAGLVTYDESSGHTSPFVDPRDNKDDTVFNDAKADHMGRLWVGTYHESEELPNAALYRVEPAGDADVGTGDGPEHHRRLGAGASRIRRKHIWCVAKTPAPAPPR